MRILLIATGGTIACIPSDKGLIPALHAGQLADYIENKSLEIDSEDIFCIDSSDMQPEDWQRLARRVYEAAEEYDGIVVTHGTDTMGYTASMLSFMLQNLPIPVVITGSQFPIVYPDSDARKNLNNALVAASGMPGGVYSVFGDAVMLGCRTVKVRTTSVNAFESINYPYSAAVLNGKLIQLHILKGSGRMALEEDIDPGVALVKLIPGTAPSLIRILSECGIHGVVAEAFGLGGMHHTRRDHVEAFEYLMDQGIPVVLRSQCLYERSSPDHYEISRDLAKSGVISAYDMTTEAAVTKLMWALKRGQSMDEIRRIMQKNLCGEIDPQAGEERGGRL